MSLVGNNIDAYCTKCKLLLSHTVVSEVGGVAHNVQCKTCGSQHKYRRAPSERKTGGKTVREVLSRRASVNSAGKQPLNATLLWELKHRDLDHDTAIREYRMNDKYKAGEVIQHHAFGVGFVERITSDTRMNVLFKDAVKMMAMNVR